jgi:two-component system cell cycle response regulator CpdR
MTASGSSAADAARPFRLLLVDDDDATRTSLSRLLEWHGFEVTAVADGTAALDALRTGPPFDVLLTDLRLPDLDGREVARWARELRPPLRIGLITGWDIETEREDPRYWGFDWVLPKPFRLPDLLAKLGAPGVPRLDPGHQYRCDRGGPPGNPPRPDPMTT